MSLSAVSPCAVASMTTANKSDKSDKSISTNADDTPQWTTPQNFPVIPDASYTATENNFVNRLNDSIAHTSFRKTIVDLIVDRFEPKFAIPWERKMDIALKGRKVNEMWIQENLWSVSYMITKKGDLPKWKHLIKLGVPLGLEHGFFNLDATMLEYLCEEG